MAKEISSQNVLSRAEQEINYISNNNIKVSTYLENDYPSRLKNCVDAPIVLYSKGDFDWNQTKIVSIVGTRNASNYGKNICQSVIEYLSDFPVLIISGLAYGIDIHAHKNAIKHNLKAATVLAHGLDKIYPSSHKNVLLEMLQNGELITEFLSETNISRENFVR